LAASLPGRALREPRLLHFVAGRPARFWDRNCLTLAGGTLEPLESIALHLAQTGIARLLTLFPAQRYSASDIEEYNRLTALEYDGIRDFLILHYKATARDGSQFWHQCRDLEVPDALRTRLELFRNCGRLALTDAEHFGHDSWLTVLLGQGVEPRNYDPLADVLEDEEVTTACARMRLAIRAAVDTLPTHREFLAAHCAASAVEPL